MYDVCCTSVQLLLYCDSVNIYDKNFKLEHIAMMAVISTAILMIYIKMIKGWQLYSHPKCFFYKLSMHQFRLDQALAASIVLDRKQGYGTVTLQIDVDVASDSGYFDINQKLKYLSHQGTNNMKGVFWLIPLFLMT